eukprot:2054362-Pyramimonas_sp.AAC.1
MACTSNFSSKSTPRFASKRRATGQVALMLAEQKRFKSREERHRKVRVHHIALVVRVLHCCASALLTERRNHIPLNFIFNMRAHCCLRDFHWAPVGGLRKSRRSRAPTRALYSGLLPYSARFSSESDPASNPCDVDQQQRVSHGGNAAAGRLVPPPPQPHLRAREANP